MARPRKADVDKLISVTTNLSRERYEQLERVARKHDMPLAVLLRRLLTQPFKNLKTAEPHTLP